MQSRNDQPAPQRRLIASACGSVLERRHWTSPLTSWSNPTCPPVIFEIAEIRSRDGRRRPVSMLFTVHLVTDINWLKSSCERGGVCDLRQIAKGCLLSIRPSCHIANLIAIAFSHKKLAMWPSTLNPSRDRFRPW